MDHSRRKFLTACVGAAAALGASTAGAEEPKGEKKSSLGLVIHSFPNRVAADRARGGKDGIDDPWNFVKYARTLGVGNVQVNFGSDPDRESLLREIRAGGMNFEAIVRLPRNQTDMPRFRDDIRAVW